MNIFQAVDGREKGAVPISIGTSLAIEAAEGVYPDRPVVTPAPITTTQLLMVNVRTLIRNAHGAVDKDYKDRVNGEHLAPVILEEMLILNTVIPEVSNGKCKVLFYLSDYQHVNPQQFRGALFKHATTPKQLAYAKLESETVEELQKKELPSNVVYFKGAIEGKYPRTFLITHYPVDLLSRYQFERLDLLETHSGNIKAPPVWGTKLTGSMMENIPLNAFTLKLFGDGVHFLGQRPSIKKEMLYWAEVDRWTGLTTTALISNSVSKVKDPQIRAELAGLL